MPLSEQEQRLLDEMERQLMSKDADVVSTSRDGQTLSYRNIVYGTVLVLLGVAGLVVGVSSEIIVIGVIAFVLMVGGVVLALTPVRGSARGPRAAVDERPDFTKKPSSSSSFMDRMNDRWDRRQGEH
ncbi:MAG: DUF3040 domain-containing protein [Microbacterium sp.]